MTGLKFGNSAFGQRYIAHILNKNQPGTQRIGLYGGPRISQQW